ncbi:YhcH/YjgK/YiaL family protein [Vibrio sp. D420a]|uniref:YhcH/YjgK/YiaL family protein n=1 Tax=Vibrio sp. D420a TaxID=2836895 RepID=UPI0025568824|nr:YhcH/YjgK/YiaL family protein [Vibrio sp. D420a]MDK9762811.1 YhcH/YjgK/YiaL family protein [Vibrio sp. D420a]
MLSQPQTITALQQSSSLPIKNAIDYVLTRFDSLETGKFSIPDSDVFGVKLDYELKSVPEYVVYERHRVYVDLHLLIRGIESISQLPQLEGETSAYNVEDDYQLCTSAERDVIQVTEGHGLMFDIHSWHATGFGVEGGQVHKVVLKIPHHLI